MKMPKGWHPDGKYCPTCLKRGRAIKIEMASRLSKNGKPMYYGKCRLYDQGCGTSYRKEKGVWILNVSVLP
jgi:hypothetical protein